MKILVNEADKVEKDALQLAIQGKDVIICGLQREIRELDEKNRILKETLARVIGGKEGDA